MKKIHLHLLAVLLISTQLLSIANAKDFLCAPTPVEMDGPFYRADAPRRNSIGTGYLLFGEVKSAVDCAPIAGARIEIWMTGPDGRYDDFGGRPYSPGRTVATTCKVTFLPPMAVDRRTSTCWLTLPASSS